MKPSDFTALIAGDKTLTVGALLAAPVAS